MSIQIIDPTLVTEAATHTLYSIGWVENKAYIYLKANGASTAGEVCLIDASGEATPATITNAATHENAGLGVAQVAVADDSYGWLQVYGPCAAISMATAVAVSTSLYAHATAGGLSSTASTGDILGIIIYTATSAAGNTNGFLTWPTTTNLSV